MYRQMCFGYTNVFFDLQMGHLLRMYRRVCLRHTNKFLTYERFVCTVNTLHTVCHLSAWGIGLLIEIKALKCATVISFT